MITDGSETQPPQPLSKLLSKKEKLLTITALSGEFPCDNFHRLHISSSYAKLLRHNLYQEGMIKSLSDDCLKGIPGRVLCFDFQMEFVAKLMKPAKVHINHIKIKDVEEMMNTENY